MLTPSETSSPDAPPASVQTTLQEAKILSNASQSTKAARLIRNGLISHPQDPQLEAVLTTYLRLSDQEMYWLKADALVKHALWLRSELRKNKVEVIARPSILKKLLISRLEVKQGHAHEELIRCASDNINSNPNLSRRCLDATNRALLSDKDFQQALFLRQQLWEQEDSRETVTSEPLPIEKSENITVIQTAPKIKRPPVNPRSEVEQLSYNLRAALNKNNYLLAKRLSDSLKRSGNSNNKDTRQLIRVTDKKIRNYADKIAQRADKLYLQEKVAEADALWVVLIKLNPENDEYRQNHERAERMLKNIKTIKEDQTGEIFSDFTQEVSP